MAYRTIDSIVLGMTAGVPVGLPPPEHLLAAAVIGAIAATFASFPKAPLSKAAITLAVPALLGPIFTVLSVALKDKTIVPAVWGIYPLMTLEWTLVGLATAVTVWPWLRRQRVLSPNT